MGADVLGTKPLGKLKDLTTAAVTVPLGIATKGVGQVLRHARPDRTTERPAPPRAVPDVPEAVPAPDPIKSHGDPVLPASVKKTAPKKAAAKKTAAKKVVAAPPATSIDAAADPSNVDATPADVAKKVAKKAPAKKTAKETAKKPSGPAT